MKLKATCLKIRILHLVLCTFYPVSCSNCTVTKMPIYTQYVAANRVVYIYRWSRIKTGYLHI